MANLFDNNNNKVDVAELKNRLSVVLGEENIEIIKLIVESILDELEE